MQSLFWYQVETSEKLPFTLHETHLNFMKHKCQCYDLWIHEALPLSTIQKTKKQITIAKENTDFDKEGNRFLVTIISILQVINILYIYLYIYSLLGDFLGVFAGVFFVVKDSPATLRLFGVFDKLALKEAEAFLDTFKLALLIKRKLMSLSEFQKLKSLALLRITWTS